MDTKRLARGLSDSRKARLLEKIEDRQRMCEFLGYKYDEKLCRKAITDLRKLLGVQYLPKR